ncbi:hypothetical protein [Altererythrobacter sp. TH136]|uniref:hypothetical protein n=1 Tax=Altererythrobacter sp. TH136 TaxID=2067415 RepID=UPI0011655F2E|nr:hypothetical protein [Altererythrobacter sp. TH136]QDM39907.1 hypothetical protein C0V74_01705 [Altererythrobacter sp. TH136]
MKKMLLAGAVALATISTAAVAAVSVIDGVGFVGKGDVQLAFGWNNSQLQKNASGLSFSYNDEASYEAVCTFTTGEGNRGEKIHNINHKTKTGVSSSVSYDARVRNQITGFNLTGLTNTVTIGGSVPVVGGACPGNAGHEGEWTAVTLVSSTGGLFVNYAGTAVALPNTPVLTTTI